MSPVIELRSLAYTVSRMGGAGGAQETVLADINLNINSGEAIACLGKNGSGKTTLLKLMAGLLEPAAGEIMFGGNQAVGDADLLGSRISWISSGVDKYFIGATVQEDLEFSLLQMGLSASDVSRKVNQVLEQFELEDFRYFQPLALDAAAKRRLAFAGAVITGPELLLIDELFSGLDAAETDYFERKIGDLTKEGCAVVRVTQRILEIMDYPRAIVLADKGIVADGKPAEIFRDPVRIAEWGLNVPVALTISSELCREGLLREPVFTVDELVREAGGRCDGRDRRDVSDGRDVSDRCDERDGRRDELDGRTERGNAGGAGSAGGVDGADAQAQLLLKPGTIVLLTGKSQTTLAEVTENLGEIACFEGFAGGQKKPGIAFLPRNPEELLIESTVWKEVILGLKSAKDVKDIAKKAARGETDARVVEVLQLCGLDPMRYYWRDPHTLSLGEQRRVAMAAILALSPEVICLEEPLEGLDAEGWESLGEILEMLRARSTAVLLVSADIDHIWKHCDTAYFIEAAGQLRGPANHNPDQILTLLVGSEFGVSGFFGASGISGTMHDLPEELRLWRYLRQSGILEDHEIGDSNGENCPGKDYFTQAIVNALNSFLKGALTMEKTGGDLQSDCEKAGAKP
jgi:energy-coupling factor transporter ATP-binding protein EcfA2